MAYREHMEKQYNEGREEGYKAWYEEGYKAGYEAGLKIGIQGTFSILRSMNIEDETIILKLCEQYKLTESEAKEYILS